MEQLTQLQKNLCIQNNVALKINLLKQIRIIKWIQTFLNSNKKIVKIKLKIVKKLIKFNNNKKIKMKKEWANNRKFKTVTKRTKKDKLHK